MRKTYDVIRLFVADSDPIREALIALLADAGFDGFLEEERQLITYRLVDESNQTAGEVMSQLPFDLSEKWSHELIPEENWNADWESSYDDVRIGDKLRIRAPFHEEMDGFDYDILIEPKMSFGTAHHPTTYLMLEAVLKHDMKGLDVLDMGSGTAVLAILASMKGASRVLAVDNDEWAYENAIENVERNPASEVEVLMGDASAIEGKMFDLILANINRNILLQDLGNYNASLHDGGTLIMSGFYEDDLPVIRHAAEKIQLRFQRYVEREQWVAATFIKS